MSLSSQRSHPLIPAAVRAIFFDAVGTLIHPDPPAAAVYAAVAARLASRMRAEEIGPRFRAAFARQELLDREQGQRTSEDREQRRWRQIVSEVLPDVSDSERCFTELWEHFNWPTSWRCAPDTAATLTELARRGYVLGMASNYDQRLRSVAAGLPELRPLRHLVISAEVGWRKPAPEFFEALCQTTELPAREILLVGDDWENDYEGGRAAGLSILLIDPLASRPEPDVRRIGCLADLVMPEGVF